MNLSFTSKAFFLAIPISSPSRSHIKLVQWLGGDVGSGDRAEGEVVAGGCMWNLNLNFSHISHASQLCLVPQGTDHFQVAFPRLPESGGFQLGSASRRHLTQMGGKEEERSHVISPSPWGSLQ